MTVSDRDRWNARYRDEDVQIEPSPWLTSLEKLPTSGRALDIAGGAGRNAVWLAERGLDVTLVDVSDTALTIAAEAARAAGVTIDARHIDLVADPLPSGPWDVVLCFHYLQRDLFPAMIAELTPGGLLVAELATVRNLERRDRPERPYLLDEGELLTLVAPLDIVVFEEGWHPDDRHEARLVARKPPVPRGGSSAQRPV